MCCCSSSFFMICHFPCFHICRSNNCSTCPICFTYHITVKIGDLSSREDGVFKWDLLTWETAPSQFTFREAIIIYYYYLKNNVQIGRQRLYMSGADPGFQVRGGAFKKIAPSRGRRENFWGISCEKSRFYAKKSYFSNFRGGARNFWGISCEKSRFYAKKIIFLPILGRARAWCAPPPPPESAPGFNAFLISLIGLYFRCLSFRVVPVNTARPDGAFLFVV